MRTRRSQSSGNSMSPQSSAGHRSVLLHEVVEYLALSAGDTVLDATLGGAGHAKAIADQLSAQGKLVGFDADEDAIERARDALSDVAPKVELIQANFRNLERELGDRGISSIDKAIFDLGWSSYQLTAGRGFSFLTDEPLSMAYAKDQQLTAHTIVNEWGEESIADVIFGWGEERYARRIAKAIVDARSKAPINSASELAQIVKSAVPPVYRYGKIHPATKTFQALRIAVNDEMGATETGIRAAWKLLNPGGRIAVITFHSIEDRLVKRLFLSLVEEGGIRITKSPITPTDEELSVNPRARSAKLRVIQKQPTNN